MSSRCRVQAESCSLKCCDYNGECPSTIRSCVNYYGENTPMVRRADYSQSRRMLGDTEIGGGIGGTILFFFVWFLYCCCRRSDVG